ncbi:hypothetical protein N431DRAFT_446650 [Stipitochalara longipes BDJ]|nr:hypothetical protein N431DRAFT_446650 [Stipitochalara longipes BDJ]
MRPFVGLHFGAFCLGTLVHLTTPQTAQQSSLETSPSSAYSSPDTALSTASPTVTFLSYVTMSNGTIPVNSSTLSTDPGMAAITQSMDMCPDCYDPNNSSKTGWQEAYQQFLNPYGELEWAAPPRGKHPLTLRDYCYGMWSSSWYRYLATAPWTDTFIPTVDDVFMPTSVNPTSTIYAFYPVVIGIIVNPSTMMPFTASPPCCGSCSFTVGAAQVYQWPLYSQPPSISSLVNQAGFTFVTCENMTTVLYSFGRHAHLSTASGPHTILYPEKSTTSSDVDTGNPFPVTYNPCTPWLSAPQQVLTLDPLWSTCLRDVAAIHDPDIQLTPGPAFGLVTSHMPNPTPVHTGNAVAGPSVSQVLAASTLPPNHPPAQASNAPPPPAFSQVAQVATFGTTIVTANSASEFIFGTQTVKPGGQVVVAGTTIYYASNGQYLNVGGTTQYMNPSFAVGTQVLSAGGPAAVISGKTYTVEAGGSSVVIDGTTEAVSQATQAPKAIQKVWVTVPAYIIDGQTMVAGGLPITSSGTVMSLESGGESVVVVVSKTMDINDILGSTASPAAFSQVGFGANSTSAGGAGTGDITSSSVGLPSSESAGVGTKTKSGAQRRVESSCLYTWLGLSLGIAVIKAMP